MKPALTEQPSLPTAEVWDGHGEFPSRLQERVGEAERLARMRNVLERVIEDDEVEGGVWCTGVRERAAMHE